MKIGYVYINVYTGYHIVIEKLGVHNIYYKYITGRKDKDFLSFRHFYNHFKYSQKFTDEEIIRDIIE